MTLRALVRVPVEDHWLTISAAVEGVEVRVERAGTLAGLAVLPEEDRIVIGFRAACVTAGRPSPGAIHVRASSQIPVGAGLAASAAATLAGALAANALLGLDLSDEQLTRLIVAVDGPVARLGAALSGCTVVVRSECNDVPAAATRQ